MTTIQTPRLLLRPFTPGDVPAYERIRAKPEVVRYLPGGVASAANAAAVASGVINHFIEHWQARGFGPWAVMERETGGLLGHCGLHHVPELDAVEVLYMLDAPAWGRGFATEGASASVQYGFSVLALDRIVALAMPENLASRRVMEKIGLCHVGPVTFRNLDAVLYEIRR